MTFSSLVASTSTHSSLLYLPVPEVPFPSLKLNEIANIKLSGKVLWMVLCISKDRAQGEKGKRGGKGKDKECFKIIKGKFPYILHPGENSLLQSWWRRTTEDPIKNPEHNNPKSIFWGEKHHTYWCAATHQVHSMAITQLLPAFRSTLQSQADFSRTPIARQNIDRQINVSTNWANCKWSDGKAPYCLLTVGPDVSLFAADDFHQAVQGAALAVEAGAVVLDLPSAAQDDLWAQREVFHQHAPVIQHFTLALTAHLSTWAKRRWCDLVSVLRGALLDLCHQRGGRECPHSE